jgi:hypothetical protein
MLSPILNHSRIHELSSKSSQNYSSLCSECATLYTVVNHGKTVNGAKGVEMRQGHATYRQEEKQKREESLPSIGTGNQDSVLLWTKCNHGTSLLWNSKLCKWPLWTEVLGQHPCHTHSINECHITPNSVKHKPPSTISKLLLHNLFIQKMLVEKHHAYMSCSMNIRQSATMIMKQIWKKA